MADEQVVLELRQDFYKDGIDRVKLIVSGISAAVACLGLLMLYLYVATPKPVIFPVEQEWRVQSQVGLDQPYLSAPALLQWVNDAMRNAFIYDFSHYNEQLKKASQYFTSDGWKVFLNQLNNYANYNTVQGNKTFINGVPAGAPVILNQGVLSGRYAWWVKVPITIHYETINRFWSRDLVLQVLLVRVSTENSLSGVGIENVIVAEDSYVR